MNTKIIDNESDISDIKDGTAQLNPRSFISGRFDSQEFVSANLSVSGWYTIAETSDVNSEVSEANFNIVWSGSARTGGNGCIVGVSGSGVAKTHFNTKIKLIPRTDNQSGSVNLGILGYRVAKSDSVNGSGFKLQANIDVSVTVSPIIQMSNNVSTNTGWQLVAPFLDNTPTLPDGVTVGTFLEAGEELSFEPLSSSSTIIPTNWSVYILDKDSADCEVMFNEIPKQGTGISITFPSVNIRVSDINGLLSSAMTSGLAFSNLSMTGKAVRFKMTKVDVFLGMQFTRPSFIQVTGTGCKLIIT